MTDKPKDDVVKHMHDFLKELDQATDTESAAAKERWIEAVTNALATDGDAVSLVMGEEGVMIYTNLNNADAHFLLSFAASMVLLQAAGTVH